MDDISRRVAGGINGFMIESRLDRRRFGATNDPLGPQMPVPFASFIDLLPDGLVIADTNRRIRYANHTLTTMTGYSIGELINQPVELLVPEQVLSAPQATRPGNGQVATAAMIGSSLDVHCERKDGTRFYADISITSVATDAGAFLVASFRDAATRQQLEGRLRETERRWNDLLNGIPLAVVGLGTDGRVTFANPFLLSVTGYEQHEVIGADWFSTFLPSEDLHQIRTVFSKVLSAQKAEYNVNPIVTKRGEQRLIAWFNTALHDPNGGMVGSVSLGEDITQQAHAEARLRAVNEVTEAILADSPLDLVLRLLARRARELVGAELAAIAILTGDGTLAIAGADGLHAERLEGATLPLEASIAGHVMRSRNALLVEDASADERAYQPIVELTDIGPALFVPLKARKDVLGMLGVQNGRGGRRFDAEDVALIELLASQTSIAIEYARAKREVQRMAVIEERGRVARDLHDLVIQRLFAIGMSLEALHFLRGEDQVMAKRLRSAIDQLDESIADIRTVIFGMQQAESGAGLRGQVLKAAYDATASLGFRPRVHFLGAVDALVRDDLAHHVLAVAREALSNVARHAQASQALVHLEVASEVILRVTDDGIGIPAKNKRRSGLGNLAARAEELGGAFTIRPGDSRGTMLEWRVPLTQL